MAAAFIVAASWSRQWGSRSNRIGRARPAGLVSVAVSKSRLITAAAASVVPKRDAFLNAAVAAGVSKDTAARALDLAEKADKTWSVQVNGAFLNPIESTALVSLFRNVADVRAVAYGGYKDAERRMVAFMRRDMEDTAGLNDPGLEDASESNEQLLRNLFGPFQTLLNVSGNFLFDAASHRDFLGATLQTGIERDVVGDIIVLGDRGAQMVVSESVASHLCAALTQVRTVPVQCRIAESWDELKVRPVSKKEISSVEASLRVDAVASAGFGISRSKMLNFIKSGAVSINWKECSSASTTLKEGDFVTVRGKGKMVLEEVQVTAKERFRVRMSRFT
ncbi:putative RNA-binding protein YlmH [Porphyridium purpureum]|uniref:Putative RNA-binding protein YlmH n=1 Tax=Porphyridium purpureum TaxID=35688 RepID=A0A5J4YM82_PORPP|nr:putative RNA-binding protein YlmH [Porphyridium purpureum]|eukprot:POR2878..scf249_10